VRFPSLIKPFSLSLFLSPPSPSLPPSKHPSLSPSSLPPTQEAEAARTISQRGVVLIATAHGSALQDVLRNPDLARLAGGVQPVVVGDAAARLVEGGGLRKTQLERSGAAVFQALVELQERRRWRVHLSVEASADALLAGAVAHAHTREWGPAAAAGGGGGGPAGPMVVTFETALAARQAAGAAAEARAATAAA
jgi:hypothetical protein